MTAQAATPALPAAKDKSAADQVMEKIRELNRNTSLLAAHGLYRVVEQALVEAQGADLEQLLKVINAMRPVATDVEKIEAQKATASAATAFFNVILDVNARQVAPPKDPDRVERVDRTPVVEVDIEDAVELVSSIVAPSTPTPTPAHDPLAALDGLADALMEGIGITAGQPDKPDPLEPLGELVWGDD